MCVCVCVCVMMDGWGPGGSADMLGGRSRVIAFTAVGKKLSLSYEVFVLILYLYLLYEEVRNSREVQEMYENSTTVVRCAVRRTEDLKVEVGLHQGSALSPFLFALVMDRLTDGGGS